MVDETDGIEEAIEGQMRLVITAAAQAGERLARMREDTLRRAQATSEREARELQSRFAAEQRTVRADLSAVQRSDWWENATPERIAQAYESAVAWREEEPEAARAEERIVDELRTRHGITPDQLRAQVAAERGETTPARYVLTEGHDDRTTAREISRDDALALIDRTPRAGDLTPTRRQQFDDMRGWTGKDRDVDLAIAAKFPQLMTESHLDVVRRTETLDHEAAARQREGQFPTSSFEGEGWVRGSTSKENALKTIEGIPADTEIPNPRDASYYGPLSDVQRWGGRDPDVDLAIAEKWPALLSEEQLAAVQQALAERERNSERREREEAAALMADATAEEDRAQDRNADRPDRPALAEEHEQRAENAREEAGTKYDSAERRASTAAELETQGHDHETVARQMRADVSQAEPATEATNGSRAPRARKGRGRAGTTRQRERGGLSR